MAAGEHWANWRDTEHLMFIKVGTGIGCGGGRARRLTAVGVEAEGVRFALEVHPTEIAYARILHVHVKDSKRRLDGRSSILGGHADFGSPGRGWDFVSPGHGDVDFEAMFRALNRIGYEGPLSIEWEDSGMDRDWGAARRAGLRAPHRLRAVLGGVRRRVLARGPTPAFGGRRGHLAVRASAA